MENAPARELPGLRAITTGANGPDRATNRRTVPDETDVPGARAFRGGVLVEPRGFAFRRPRPTDRPSPTRVPDGTGQPTYPTRADRFSGRYRRDRPMNRRRRRVSVGNPQGQEERLSLPPPFQT